MRKGFTLIESLFSFCILSIISVLVIGNIVYVYTSYQKNKEFYTQQIMSMEQKLNSISLPVEDLQWAIKQVLS